MSQGIFRGGRPAAALALTCILAAACEWLEPRGEPNARVREVIGQDSTPLLEFSGGDTLHISQPVADFYRERGYRQAWTDYDEVLDRGVALLETMGRTEEDGLDPERYRYPLAASMLREVEEDSLEEEQEPGQMGELDIVLSEVFARYATNLTGGALDPRVAGLDWEIPRPTIDAKALLDSIVDGKDPAAVVAALRPHASEYRRMMEALARYREIEEAGGWMSLPAGELPEAGDTAPIVGALRARLIAERDPFEQRLAGAGKSSPDRFDEQLKQAFAHFQERHGLKPDGALGTLTRQELDKPAVQRIAELQLNLDRWRWLPRDLGDMYIMVNVAGFELEFIEDDSVLLATNVVVGKDAWRTPIFRDTMETIVVNPYWNVPASIEKAEVLPALQENPDYLAEEHMEVLLNGKPVPPGEIDWSKLDGESSPYRFRQLPGKGNALGQVKFLFPNKDNIYLHDTPATQLFSQSSRAFSHGCIRVERPRDLARLVIAKATDQSPDRFDELTKLDTEQYIPLTKPLPVYILYFTAYAQRDGSVSFHPDIYRRDYILEQQTAARRETVRVATLPAHTTSHD